MSEDYLIEDAYRSKLDAEGLLLMHMNRIGMYRDTDHKRYCSSIETLIIMCPRNIRNKSFGYLSELGLRRGSYHQISEDLLVKYDDMLIFVNEQLEKNHMIWKTRETKVFS